MSNTNLPPFYVGQKVVCVDNSDQSGAMFLIKDHFVKGRVYTVLAVRKGCCIWEIDVGVRISDDPGYTKCLLCNCIEYDNGDPVFWVSSTRFAPIEENFQSITLEKVMEKETPLIGAN